MKFGSQLSVKTKRILFFLLAFGSLGEVQFDHSADGVATNTGWVKFCVESLILDCNGRYL